MRFILFFLIATSIFHRVEAISVEGVAIKVLADKIASTVRASSEARVFAQSLFKNASTQLINQKSFSIDIEKDFRAASYEKRVSTVLNLLCELNGNTNCTENKVRYELFSRRYSQEFKHERICHLTILPISTTSLSPSIKKQISNLLYSEIIQQNIAYRSHNARYYLHLDSRDFATLNKNGYHQNNIELEIMIMDSTTLEPIFKKTVKSSSEGYSSEHFEELVLQFEDVISKDLKSALLGDCE